MTATTTRQIRRTITRTSARRARKNRGSDLTFTDAFCGAGGSDQGAEQVPGVVSTYAINHWQTALDTHNENMPHVDHLRADLSRAGHPDGFDPRKIAPTDLGWFSPECFPAGTTILTRRGVTPIEDVQIGDEVWTHRGRWRQVTRVMSKSADTVTVAGYGHSRLETTADHPIYARSTSRCWDNEARRQRRVYGTPEWVAAGDLAPAPPTSRPGTGHFWASPIEFDEIDIPQVHRRGATFDEDFWWLVGRWLGDGCLRAARGEVQVTCGLHESSGLEKRLSAVPGLRWLRRDLRTATVFTAGHVGLSNWLFQNFGEHAEGKTMPAWALGMTRAWRVALLDGYVSADGGQYDRPEQRPVVQTHSVSRRLAVGIRLLALSLGHKASLSLSDKRTDGIIEGRLVKMRPLWRVHWCADPSPKHNMTFVEDGIRWAPVRKVQPARSQVEVFNLSVDEDESYVADGIVVHNCTTWSYARGKRVDYDERAAQPALWDDDEPAADESVARSRFQMETVVAFVRVHHYRAFVVENVPAILKWWDLSRWIRELTAEGYDYKIVHLNSAFAGKLGDPAPQLRDRVYFVFWRREYTRPDFDRWLRPRAWCPTCERDVDAMWVPNTPDVVRPMRYGVQYHYRCPAVSCRGGKVWPYTLPAAAAIDWDLPGERIGDRARPLAPKTLDRIRAGLARYGRPIHLEAAGNTFERRPGVRSWPLDEPLRTIHTTASKAIAYSDPLIIALRNNTAAQRTADGLLPTIAAGGNHHGLLVPCGGSRNDTAAPLDRPLRTRTTTESEGLLQFPAMVLRNQNSRGGNMCTPVEEPVRTVTASCLQSLIRWDHHLLFPYDAKRNLRTLDRPLPTQTTVEGDAVLGAAIAVEDCTFRMLDVHEIKAGSAFPAGFRMTFGSRRDRVKMLGNAVTPNAARDLIGMLVEAITGELVAA